MKKALIYGLKFLGRLLLVLLLIILLISLFIQTRPVKDRIAGIAENQASKFINGNLRIGQLDGNFFAHLLLKDVLLTDNSDTLAYVSELDLRYNLLSLFNGTIDLHAVVVENPYLYLEQLNDSTWNLQQLVEPGEQEQDTTTAGAININLSSFKLNNGHILINSPDTIIPQKITNLNAALSLYWSNEKTQAEIDNISLATVNPDIQLNQLSLKFDMNNNKAELEQLVIKTAKNRIEGEAQYHADPVNRGNARFRTEPLYLDEFSFLMSDLKITANPVIDLKGEMLQDSITVVLNVNDNNQEVLATINSGNLIEYFFRDTTALLRYQLETRIKNVNPGYWIGDPEMNYIINGSINARGLGLDPATADIVLRANLNESTIEDQSFSNVAANFALKAGNLSGTIQGTGGFGEFYLAPQVKNLMGDPTYQLTFNSNNLNLAVVTGDDSLQSNINLQAKLKGRSFDPKKIAADGEVLVFNSSFQELHLDTLMTRFQYENENIQIDSLWLLSGNVTAEATGNYSLTSNSDLRLSIHFDGLEEFKNFLPEVELSSRGTMEARVAGVPDSLEIEMALRLDSTRYDTIAFKSLQLMANGKITTTDTLFNATAYIDNLDLGTFYMDSITARIEGSLDSVFLQTQILAQDLRTELHAGIVPGDKLAITIPVWDISYKTQQWSMQQPPAYIELDSVNYFIDNFRMTSGTSDTAQYLSIQGHISRSGKENFRLEAGNLQIKQLAEMMDTEFNGSGLADLTFIMEGTSDSPLIEGQFRIRNAELNQYQFTTLRGNMNYRDNMLLFESLVIPQDSGRFEISASMPLELNLDTMGFHFSPEDSLSAQVLIQEFSLAILNSFDIPVQTTGHLEGKVNVNGTATNPNPEGTVRLVNASFAMPEFGINYRDVRLNLNFLRDRIELDTFRIRTRDGDLTGTGLVNFGSDFYKGDISDSKIKLNFNRFNPVNHRQFNMQVDGYAELKGEADSVVFGGDLSIPQSEFYLPAIFRLMGRMDTKEMPKPILVQELENMSVSLDSLGIMEFETKQPDSVTFTYFDNLKGQLRVRIPRNTWIKNDDMRVEISGELDLIKELDFFEIFGQVEVVRGQYELLGRVFVINEGTVNFLGGEEMNLKMDVEASYTFRNNQQVQQELTVNISGTIEEPEINFELDGNAIEEGDALSYILFGKSMDELTINEQDNMESAGIGNLAQQAAASLISAQLTNFLQNKLDVDYIEVKGGGGFDEASVVVGKYITNRLFVSYEQRFGQTDEQNLKKYEVKLEYELFRFLFFEINNSTIDSGFDIIFRFDVI